jgi:hypothetical protein
MTFSTESLDQIIHQALKQWQTADETDLPLHQLNLARQLVRDGVDPRRITHELLQPALEILAEADAGKAALLRLRYEEELPVHVVANRLGIAEATLHRRQQQAIAHLARIIDEQESQARARYQAELDQRLLLPPREELVGVREYFSRLLPLLTTAGPPWLISIEGLGGIGKTALAGALLRHPDLMYPFTDLAWVSAKPQDFYPGLELVENPRAALSPQALIEALLKQLWPEQPLPDSPGERQMLLSRRLKERPILVVVDNLETIVDYETLLPLLSQLASPGKFILTSRHSLRQVSPVYCCQLAALSLADALEFIRSQARRRSIEALTAATDADLTRIFEVVGGHPLALKLVIGQLSALPLAQVIDHLKSATGREIDQLYTYIYWQAWQMLAPPGQQLLLMMPLAQHGSFDQLLALSQLAPADLSQAIHQLARLSLLQISGSLATPRYTIHRLTETFLLNEAIKWRPQA